MSYAIPKIEYNQQATTGTTTSGNGTITSVASTTGLLVGMAVRGTGIPAGATIGSIGSGTITLANSVKATANGSLVALTFAVVIAFSYPPIELGGRALEGKGTTSESLSGIRQVSTNYIEETRPLNFSHISQDTYNLMDTFLSTWACFGKSFSYFEDQTLTPFTTYELATFKTIPKRGNSVSATDYVWDLPLTFRRAL